MILRFRFAAIILRAMLTLCTPAIFAMTPLSLMLAATISLIMLIDAFHYY